MATGRTDPSIETSIRELLATLRRIEDAVEPPEPRRLLRPPTPRGFREFTSEVGIPAAILVLRTNIAVLELLQRTLRMAGERDARGGTDDDRVGIDGDRGGTDGDHGGTDTGRGGTDTGRGAPPGPAVRDHATELTRTSLSRLDAVLADLQQAIDGRSIDRSPDEILAEARERTEQLEASLEGIEEGSDEPPLGGGRSPGVDVDAELASLRESVEDRTASDDSTPESDDE